MTMDTGQSKTMLYLNSVTQENSGCVGRRHKTVKLLKSLLLIIGWLAENHEAAVAGFPKICLFSPSFLYKFVQILIQTCQKNCKSITWRGLWIICVFSFSVFLLTFLKFQKQLVWNRFTAARCVRET